MGQISAAIDLIASPEKVFEIATDPSQFENWMAIHSSWKGDVPSEFQKGAQIAEVVTMLGMPNTITWNVDEFQVPTRLCLSGTGMAGVKAQIEIDVTPRGDGASTLSLAATFEGSMIVGALGKAVEKDGMKQLEASLEKFQGLLS